MLYYNFKIGNRVRYKPSAPELQETDATIISIKETMGEPEYLLKLDKPTRYGFDEQRADQSEVDPIVITPELLLKLGYSQGEDKLLFCGSPIDIVNHTEFQPTKDWQGNASNCYKGNDFLAINEPIHDWKNEDEISKKTSSVHFVHYLQNYLEEFHSQKLIIPTNN